MKKLFFFSIPRNKTRKEIIEVIKNALIANGWKFVEKSEINANPRDLKNYKKGVWSLPPRFSDGKKTQYLNIGESDRMTLKFIKL